MPLERHRICAAGKKVKNLGLPRASYTLFLSFVRGMVSLESKFRTIGDGSALLDRDSR